MPEAITRQAAARLEFGNIEALQATGAVELNPSAAAPPATSSAAVMTIGKDAKGNTAYCPPPEEFDTSKPMLKHSGQPIEAKEKLLTLGAKRTNREPAKSEN